MMQFVMQFVLLKFSQAHPNQLTSGTQFVMQFVMQFVLLKFSQAHPNQLTSGTQFVMQFVTCLTSCSCRAS